MVKSERKLKNKKILLSAILAIIMLVSFAAQAYGATIQSAKAVSKTTKTYEYGFNNRSKNSLTSIGDGMNCTFEHV